MVKKYWMHATHSDDVEAEEIGSTPLVYIRDADMRAWVLASDYEEAQARIRELEDSLKLSNAVRDVLAAELKLQDEANDILTRKVSELEAALGRLVENCRDYPAWERPCHAFDEAVKTLNAHKWENTTAATKGVLDQYFAAETPGVKSE